MSEKFTTRRNVMAVSSMNTFANIRGGFNNGCKDVYFCRLIGANETYVEHVREMDQILGARQQGGEVYYQRRRELPRVGLSEEMDRFVRIYREWRDGGQTGISFPLTGSGQFSDALSAACAQVWEMYRSINPMCSESQEQNFMVKILYWLNAVTDGFLLAWDERMCVKLVAENVCKKQEYLFYYFLTLLGVDVLLLQYRADIDAEMKERGLSTECVLGSPADLSLPDVTYVERKKPDVARLERRKKRKPPVIRIAADADIPRPAAVPAMNPSPAAGQSQVSGQQSRAALPTGDAVRPSSGQREKTYEELALLSSSVVLIGIHNQSGEVIGTGSGIMIHEDGFILTNNHVASGGVFYSVKIEDDDKTYSTDEIIKYNQNFDLAIIRIDRQLKPLQIYRGPDKLVRGQRVVAIGSPLGLFNSISDGIIAGFRKLDNVDMIQFTAPISHGSSGGAVLNMYGEVVGISTAGFDDGQNINLAMGYECIRMFAKGFLK